MPNLHNIFISAKYLIKLNNYDKLCFGYFTEIFHILGTNLLLVQYYSMLSAAAVYDSFNGILG